MASVLVGDAGRSGRLGVINVVGVTGDGDERASLHRGLREGFARGQLAPLVRVVVAAEEAAFVQRLHDALVDAHEHRLELRSRRGRRLHEPQRAGVILHVHAIGEME
jgi:hypothetical protein